MRRDRIRHVSAALVPQLLSAVLLLAACSASTSSATTQQTPTAAATATPTSSSAAASVSATALPLGDGHVGSTPRVGWVDSCTTSFPSSGGASVNGPWIHGTTWDSTAKIAVQGTVKWPQASYSVTVSGGRRVVASNDLPVGFPTGSFPISPSDPASQYDRNPNSIMPQSVNYTLPANPTVAASPTCLSLGPIGVLKDGVLLFDALDAEGRDAQAHEVQDSCSGHPQMNDMYHYHSVSKCILTTATGSSTLVGYALDGFGIYVERDAHGNLPTDADLDACHGRTSTVLWDGKEVSMYHYVATAEYPYTLGCFMGTPVRGLPGA